jgi:hypothetical protein
VRTVSTRRYVTPLREGGSLPAIVEADDLGTYVLKFRGAGQGPKVLVAELVAGEIARALALPVPEIVLVELDPVIGRNEPDYEIRSLIQASGGLNLGLDYLPGAIAYDPALARPDPGLAARVVWFDALVMNVDRTARNSNLLFWHGELYLIDHGAALYPHHDWPGGLARGRAPFPHIRQHVLLPHAPADALAAADADLAPLVDEQLLRGVLDAVPDDWLPAPAGDARSAYLDFFRARLAPPRLFLADASA